MLESNHLIGFGVESGNLSLWDAINQSGLASGLVYCWDIGDTGAYSGSGQTITDQSGNGNHFFLGATSGSEASDPTFTGSAGDKRASTYLSYDGGDYNRLAVSNPTAINSLHKDNAKFVALFLVRTAASFAANPSLCGTLAGTGSNIGIHFFLDTSGKPRFLVGNGDGTVEITVTGDSGLSASTIYALAVSFDEAVGAGGGYFWANGNFLQVSAANTWTSTIASPSASAATYTYEIGAGGNASQIVDSGTRILGSALWSTTIPSKANLDTLYTLLTSRLT